MVLIMLSYLLLQALLKYLLKVFYMHYSDSQQLCELVTIIGIIVTKP